MNYLRKQQRIFDQWATRARVVTARRALALKPIGEALSNAALFPPREAARDWQCRSKHCHAFVVRGERVVRSRSSIPLSIIKVNANFRSVLNLQRFNRKLKKVKSRGWRSCAGNNIVKLHRHPYS